MKWFTGDIAGAISLAKSRGAIFVVYCEGKDDETSKQMSDLIETEAIASKLESDSFVSIKIESDKEEYMQFAKIYQLVPVPSIFFIKNGIPVKIVTGTIKTVQELEEAINGVIKNETSIGQSSSQQQQSSPTPAASSGDSVVVVENNNQESSSQDAPADNKKVEAEKQEQIQIALKLVEQKRIDKIKEERRLEKEREVLRRKDGQELQNLKKWQEDQEMKQIKEDRLKEKNAEKAARQRVLDQIEQDKKERAQRFGSQSTTPKPAETQVTPPAAKTPIFGIPNSARIQFKKPDGETEIVTFDSGMMFSDLHLFVKDDILHGTVKEFTLATTFPRREFGQADFDKSLADLGLIPSSVLLIIPGKKALTFTSRPSSVLPTTTDGSFMAMMLALFTGLFTPVMALFNYLKGFVFRGGEAGPAETPNEAGKRKRNEELLLANDAAKKRNLKAFNNSQPEAGSSQPSSSPTGTIPKSGAYKRPSNNIHRLHQNSDSEDEDKKTYNGNSTQQL